MILSESLSRVWFIFFLGIDSRIARKLSWNEKIRSIRCAFGKVDRLSFVHREERRAVARKKISVPSGGSDRTRSFRIRCLEERRLKIRMFRWLSRKGGVQASYTRVIDLRHPKMLGSNRASMNSPFFFSLLSLSPFPRLIAAIVLLVRVRCRCVASHRRDPFDRALGFSSVLLPFPISDTSYLISSAATPAWKPFGQYGSDTKRVTVITAVYATSAISDTRLAWVNRP